MGNTQHSEQSIGYALNTAYQNVTSKVSCFGNIRIRRDEIRSSGTIMAIQSYTQVKNSANTLKKNVKRIWFFNQMTKIRLTKTRISLENPFVIPLERPLLFQDVAERQDCYSKAT
jgi:hypothetical protein